MVGITVSMSIRISVISVVSAISSIGISVISVSVTVSVMAVVVCGGIGTSFGFRCSFGIG